MTLEGIKKNIALLKLAYVNYYKEATTEDIQALIKLWEMQFNEYEDNLVASAINCLISTSKYPPTIADIKETIVSFNNNGLSVQEAWEKVITCARSDIRNLYHELEPNIRKVMTYEDVMELGFGDKSNTPFIKNRFINDYKEVIKKQTELNKIPIKEMKQIRERNTDETNY